MSRKPSEGAVADAAAIFFGVVLAVAVVSTVLDGGRPAFAADDCQYGPYALRAVRSVRPTVREGAPKPQDHCSCHRRNRHQRSAGRDPRERQRSDGDARPSRLHRPGQQCANPSQPPFWLAQVEVRGNGAYSASLPFGVPQAFDQLGTWTWSATYVGDARNELTHTICGTHTTNVTKRTPWVESHELDPCAVRARSLRGCSRGVLRVSAEQPADRCAPRPR